MCFLQAFGATANASDGLPTRFQSTTVKLQNPGVISLPALGNTPESDRLLLREIGDQLIFTAASKSDNTGSGTWQQPSASAQRDQTQTAATVWEFVRQSNRLQVPDNDRVRFYRQQYRDEALWISKILRRANPFAGHIVESLDARYLPVELVLLPAIETGYRPDVYSKKNAGGLWQIIPSTADEIGIPRNVWFDGRADIRMSTTAALDYLSYLNAEFHGDWLLTLAAYNAGMGRVRNAVRQNKRRGLPTDFWSLSLPEETRNYVPKFLALLAMMRHDRPKQLEIPRIGRGSAFDVVNAGQRISLDRVASSTGLPLSVLAPLNSALLRKVTPPSGPHVVYLPQGFGTPFVKDLLANTAEQLFTSNYVHTVLAGDNLSILAQRYGISQQRLMAINSLTDSTIRIGQQLYLAEKAHGTSGSWEYVVTIGDTLSDIAARFSVSMANIRDENGRALTDDIIHPGERLSLVVGKEGASTQ